MDSAWDKYIFIVKPIFQRTQILLKTIMTIPHIIHYCWLSNGPYPEQALSCMESWKHFLPDYEIRLWDLKRFDIKESIWVQEALDKRQYAFAADYIRLFALYHYGGIYLDLDVEVLKSFDDLTRLPYFLGREKASNIIEAAIIGTEPNSPWVKECLNYYEKRHFILNEKEIDQTTLPQIMKKCLSQKYSLHYIHSVKDFKNDKKIINVFSSDFFSPKHLKTFLISRTNHTYTIHHFSGSWTSPYAKEYKRLFLAYYGRFGFVIAWILCKKYALEYNIKKYGILGVIKKCGDPFQNLLFKKTLHK